MDFSWDWIVENTNALKFLKDEIDYFKLEDIDNLLKNMAYHIDSYIECNNEFIHHNGYDRDAVYDSMAQWQYDYYNNFSWQDELKYTTNIEITDQLINLEFILNNTNFKELIVKCINYRFRNIYELNYICRNLKYKKKDIYDGDIIADHTNYIINRTNLKEIIIEYNSRKYFRDIPIPLYVNNEFKKELIQYLHKPKLIQKWILAGNNVDDYLNL